MSKDSKKPAIRFKGFTDDWEQRKLGDLANVYDGVHQTPDYKENGIMFLSVENITTLTSNKYISNEDFEKYYKIFPEKGDVLMTRIGDIGTPNVVESSEKIAYYVSLALLKLKNTDPYFLNNAIQTSLFQDDLKKHSLTTAIPMKINKDEIGKVNIVVTPNREEQKKIGQFFKSLDNLITLHQRKLDKLKNIKKALLEKMFPRNGENIPEVRFKGFSDDWEQRKFSELYAKVTEKNDLSFGADKIISVANMYFKEDTKESSDDYMKTYNVMRLGDIAFEGNRNKNYAHGRFVENTIGDGIVSHVFDVFRPIVDYDLNYWKYYINNEIVMGRTMARCTKSSTMMTNLVANDFLKEAVLVPVLEEQKKIGQYFSKLDNLITLHQRKLDKLKNIKKALLEKMFV